MKAFLLKYSLKLFVYLLVIFTPIIPTVLWLGFFVFVDLITGIWKARKLLQPISSKRMSETLTKLMLYFAAILCGQVMDTIFLGGVSWLPIKIAPLIAGYIAVVEFKSIIENVSSVVGLPLWDFLKEQLYRKKND